MLQRPPFTYHATPPRHATPPPNDSPTHHNDEGGADTGYPTTRTAQRNTHHPHTTHLATNSTRYDNSAHQYCVGMSGARVTPLDRASQQQHTPPPFHTPHTGEDGHHPPIHSHTVHVHTTNERS